MCCCSVGSLVRDIFASFKLHGRHGAPSKSMFACVGGWAWGGLFVRSKWGVGWDDFFVAKKKEGLVEVGGVRGRGNLGLNFWNCLNWKGEGVDEKQTKNM